MGYEKPTQSEMLNALREHGYATEYLDQLSEARIEALYEELKSVIGNIAGEMADGRSAAAPKITRGVKECGYCPFGSVCRTGGR